jgi:hypothetical protein
MAPPPPPPPPLPLLDAKMPASLAEKKPQLPKPARNPAKNGSAMPSSRNVYDDNDDYEEEEGEEDDGVVLNGNGHAAQVSRSSRRRALGGTGGWEAGADGGEDRDEDEDADEDEDDSDYGPSDLDENQCRVVEPGGDMPLLEAGSDGGAESSRPTQHAQRDGRKTEGRTREGDGEEECGAEGISSSSSSSNSKQPQLLSDAESVDGYRPQDDNEEDPDNQRSEPALAQPVAGLLPPPAWTKRTHLLDLPDDILHMIVQEVCCRGVSLCSRGLSLLPRPLSPFPWSLSLFSWPPPPANLPA